MIDVGGDRRFSGHGPLRRRARVDRVELAKQAGITGVEQISLLARRAVENPFLKNLTLMKWRLLESFAYVAFPPIWPRVEGFALAAFPVLYIFNSTEKPTGCKAAFLDKGGDHGILPKWLRSSIQYFDRGADNSSPRLNNDKNVNKLFRKVKKVSRTPSVAQQSLPCSQPYFAQPQHH